jgi:hypothetical protein
VGVNAYYANQNFFKIRLVTKRYKLKLSRTVIRPVVKYASGTWALKESIIQKLREKNYKKNIWAHERK